MKYIGKDQTRPRLRALRKSNSSIDIKSNLNSGKKKISNFNEKK